MSSSHLHCGASGAVRPSACNRLAFSLVELLVVIAVIGILTALLLPAVQSAREAARLLECQNHLKQIGLACHSHNSAHGFFPTGGWGPRWAGDPDQGFDRRQPGGWAYNILPFMEERSLHDIGKGLPYGSATDKRDALADAAQSAVSIFLCPSRRGQTALFVFTQQSASYANINLRSTQNVSRGDYCANAGDQIFNGELATPQGVGQMNDVKFAFDRTDDPMSRGYSTGISYYQSAISNRQITDGLSRKYLVGEKFLYQDRYFSGDDPGDNGWHWSGWDNDLFRTAGINYRGKPAPTPLTPSPIPPQHDMPSASADTTTQLYEDNMWGSAHQTGFNMVYCDGSVHLLPLGVDLLVHRRFHNRASGFE